MTNESYLNVSYFAAVILGLIPFSSWILIKLSRSLKLQAWQKYIGQQRAKEILSRTQRVMQGILAVIILSLAGYYIVILYYNIFSGDFYYLFHWNVIVITLVLTSRIYKLIKNYKERKQIDERASDTALSSQKTSIIPYIIGAVIVDIAIAVMAARRVRVPAFYVDVGSPWPQYILRTCVAALEISGVVYVAIKIYKEVKKGKTLKDISFGAILAGATFLVLLISGLFLSVPWFPISIVILPLTMFYLGKLIEDVCEDSIRLRKSPFFKHTVSSILLTTLVFIHMYILKGYFLPLAAGSLIARFFSYYYTDVCATGLFALFTPALAWYLRAMIKGNIEGKTVDKVKAILSKKLSKRKIGKGVTNYISKRRKDWIRAAGLTLANIVIVKLSIHQAPLFGPLVVLLGWALWWAARVIVNMILKENTRVKIKGLTSRIIPADYSQKLSSSTLRLIGTTLFWAIGLSVVCEGIGFSSTPDIFDVVAYFAGGGLFVLLWEILRAKKGRLTFFHTDSSSSASKKWNIMKPPAAGGLRSLTVSIIIVARRRKAVRTSYARL